MTVVRKAARLRNSQAAEALPLHSGRLRLDKRGSDPASPARVAGSGPTLTPAPYLTEDIKSGVRGHSDPVRAAFLARLTPAIREAIGRAHGTTMASRISEVESGCWLWTGYRNNCGYSLWRGRSGGRWITRSVHRWLYLLLRGPIPVGLECDHLCRVRACVNPWHLELVTRSENLLRGSRARGLKRFCERGHEYTEANTYWPPGGYRMCRACQSIRDKQCRSRKRILMAPPPHGVSRHAAESTQAGSP